jgi:hypothetical protein
MTVSYSKHDYARALLPREVSCPAELKAPTISYQRFVKELRLLCRRLVDTEHSRVAKLETQLTAPFSEAERLLFFVQV